MGESSPSILRGASTARWPPSAHCSVSKVYANASEDVDPDHIFHPDDMDNVDPDDKDLKYSFHLMVYTEKFVLFICPVTLS